ncbi:ABC transporter substrate-binding protein [Cellulosimicrobium cellulans]|uniref:ABC transporter substrate-binding protein n=1 Tax=Cellulosimicrobium cellulans TaxID=1710 RepID=UPI000D37816F|nr:ABC transporter substrate-binding protein [Sphaerisporangium cinnabarinum]MCR1980682.1 ABC transporter substrate-binding protein [Cellulosimicrobium cellulans]PTU56231.1 peptide ABC transporter substrate-binding protein [Sphaerisporangium cinnabarinum]
MIRSTARKRLLTAAALVTGVSLLASACTGGGSGEGEGDGGGEARVLNVWAGTQTPMVANFNPYAPNPLHVTNGGIYEPLFFYNRAEAGDPTPRLGESYEWSEDGTELTVTIREGVKWSDGEDFTVEDVIFSYTNDAAKRDYLNTIDKVDESTVKFTFNGAQFTSAVQILGTTLMVPEHLFKEVPDLITYTNEEPVGTGPFTLDTITNATYTVVPNEDYWGGEPKLEKVRFLALDKNQSAQDLLATGKIDWTTMFIADPETVTGAGQVSLLNTPQDPTTIMSCSNAALGCAGPQTDLAVRQAVNLLVDRGEINEKAFSGHAAVASPSLALVGRDDRWISSEIEKESPQEGDPAEAAKVLEAAGYTKGADGIFEKDGQKLSVDLISVDGWSDHNAAGDLIAQQALEAGVQINHVKITQQEMSDARTSGNYQMMISGITGTSLDDPFAIYRQWLTTEYTTPVGETIEAGRFNFPRYSNPLVDEAVATAAGTNDEDAKKAAYATVQKEIARDLPYIALVVNPTMSFVNTKNYTGWPSEDDMYAFPPSWATISNGVILSQLEPAS